MATRRSYGYGTAQMVQPPPNRNPLPPPPDGKPPVRLPVEGDPNAQGQDPNGDLGQGDPLIRLLQMMRQGNGSP